MENCPQLFSYTILVTNTQLQVTFIIVRCSWTPVTGHITDTCIVNKSTSCCLSRNEFDVNYLHSDPFRADHTLRLVLHLLFPNSEVTTAGSSSQLTATATNWW